VELAAGATNSLVLLSLALAVWHPQREQRIFWTGFCVLGLGNFVLAKHFSAYAHTRAQITNAVVSVDPPAITVYPYPGNTGFVASDPAAIAPVILGGHVTMTNVGIPMNYDQQRQQQAIMQAVPPMISLLAAGIGGWLMLWIARSQKTEQAT
jgi:hypothetical protein